MFICLKQPTCFKCHPIFLKEYKYFTTTDHYLVTDNNNYQQKPKKLLKQIK